MQLFFLKKKLRTGSLHIIKKPVEMNRPPTRIAKPDEIRGCGVANPLPAHAFGTALYAPDQRAGARGVGSPPMIPTSLKNGGAVRWPTPCRPMLLGRLFTPPTRGRGRGGLGGSRRSRHARRAANHIMPISYSVLKPRDGRSKKSMHSHPKNSAHKIIHLSTSCIKSRRIPGTDPHVFLQ